MNDAIRLSELERRALEEAARFRLLADNVPVSIALFQRDDFRCLFANRRYSETFGFTPESIVGLRVSEIIGDEAAALIEPQVTRVVEKVEVASYERVLRPEGKKPQWVEVNLLPHADAHGEVVGAFVLISDITKHRDAEAALRESETRLEKFLLATLEGIVFHRAGTVTDVNPPLCALLGYSKEELIGRFVMDFVSEEERPRVERVMLEQQELRYESVLVNRSGERVAVELISRTLEFGGERLRMNVVRDLREHLASQARISYLAERDALTGLMNRASFMDHLSAAIERSCESAGQLALVFVDLNDFKRVNDSLGHLEGDRVLVTVAERLQACLRATDQVARFGGDEFVVLLEEVQGQEDVVPVLQALLRIVEVPVETLGRSVSVTPSIGIAMYPEHGSTAEVLMQHADTAMYEAKAIGGKEWQFFRPAMAASAFADLIIEGQLRDALARHEFELFFQPQIDPTSDRLVGAEALLRWRHPERGLLAPDAFIAVAERNPLMLPLSEWVLREAAKHAKQWRTHSGLSVPVAVNLSQMQFRLEGFAATVHQVLVDLDMPGSWLQLELTERMLMTDVQTAIETLTELRAMGVSIAVDDFGTGHTALAHLIQLPVDKLKIDQSFVSGLPHEPGPVAVAHAILKMAHGLGFRVCAEGVRSAAQAQCLKDWGCDELQGEWIALPMSSLDFQEWASVRGGDHRG
ncbi:MAG: putative bifunctional diguanylate cyclase/phosphodiesterase [Burkholderiales bacterium]|jgi:diguanylate cyclase (GGDEF)-like protein/PAS domain S-box-containing protein